LVALVIAIVETAKKDVSRIAYSQSEQMPFNPLLEFSEQLNMWQKLTNLQTL